MHLIHYYTTEWYSNGTMESLNYSHIHTCGMSPSVPELLVYNRILSKSINRLYSQYLNPRHIMHEMMSSSHHH